MVVQLMKRSANENRQRNRATDVTLFQQDCTAIHVCFSCIMMQLKKTPNPTTTSPCLVWTNTAAYSYFAGKHDLRTQETSGSFCGEVLPRDSVQPSEEIDTVAVSYHWPPAEEVTVMRQIFCKATVANSV